MFEVSDLDGVTRYYGKKDGTLRSGDFKAVDWVDVSVKSDGTFVYDETGYTLADRMFQRDFMRLNCRFIPGQGYFLWWDASARPDEFNPRPGFLPERSSLIRDADIKWVPVEESSRFDLTPILGQTFLVHSEGRFFTRAAHLFSRSLISLPAAYLCISR